MSDCSEPNSSLSIYSTSYLLRLKTEHPLPRSQYDAITMQHLQDTKLCLELQDSLVLMVRLIYMNSAETQRLPTMLTHWGVSLISGPDYGLTIGHITAAQW